MRTLGYEDDSVQEESFNGKQFAINVLNGTNKLTIEIAIVGVAIIAYYLLSSAFGLGLVASIAIFFFIGIVAFLIASKLETGYWTQSILYKIRRCTH